MAYNGYVMKFGDDEFDMGYIYRDSFAVTPNRRQDLDSYRNANGKLIRNVLNHTATTITFQTKPMKRHDFAVMMNFIRNHYGSTNPAYSISLAQKERRVPITYYSPDVNDYRTGDFYMPDFEVTAIYQDSNDELWYNTCTLEFIEY